MKNYVCFHCTRVYKKLKLNVWKNKKIKIVSLRINKQNTHSFPPNKLVCTHSEFLHTTRATGWSGQRRACIGASFILYDLISSVDSFSINILVWKFRWNRVENACTRHSTKEGRQMSDALRTQRKCLENHRKQFSASQSCSTFPTILSFNCENIVTNGVNKREPDFFGFVIL